MTTETGADANNEEGATAPRPVAPSVPKKVIVIDDELAGLSYSHLPDTVTKLFEDRTSPEFLELWSLVMHIKGFSDLATEDNDKVRIYVSSDSIVQEVVLSSHFEATATALLKGPLTTFLERAQDVHKLREHFKNAFPAPGYDIVFESARPSLSADLLKCDLLVLDLVLKKSAGAVDEIVDCLRTLGKTTYPKPLPCIIVMSSQPELINQRMRFSNESNISAAGLLILPKSEVTKENFGASGLMLSYQQLDRQRDVALRMRIFMREWINALEQAKEKASIALWNLDAAAMQEIHLESFKDNDPYDEHLNELIVREYLWHVEASSDVNKAIEALDDCFQAQFKTGCTPAAIGQRFIAPFVKPKHKRELVSHFTWTGFKLPTALSTMKKEDAIKNFAKLVPFGALLAPDNLTSDSECLIHITQQCDLNQAKNPNKVRQSAQFTVVQPVEVHDYKIPSHDTVDLVARGLFIQGKEYDFKLVKGRQLALAIPKFIDYAASEKLRVIGRLRHDIATHFLLATANHMTRWASQKFSHVEVKDARLYLHGENFPNGKLIQLLDLTTNQAMTVQVATCNKLIYFQDDTSMRIALWIKQELKNHYPNLDIDAAYVCNALSVGRRDKECLMKIVDLKMAGIKEAEIATNLNHENFPDKRVNLMVVFEPEVT